MEKIKVKTNKPVFLGLSILEISKTKQCMNFGMVILTQNIKAKQI